MSDSIAFATIAVAAIAASVFSRGDKAFGYFLLAAVAIFAGLWS